MHQIKKQMLDVVSKWKSQKLGRNGNYRETPLRQHFCGGWAISILLPLKSRKPTNVLTFSQRRANYAIVEQKKKKSGQCLVITSILEPALFSRICCLYRTIIINCAAIRETGICRFGFPLLPSHAHFSQRAPSIMPCKLSLFVFVFFGTGKLFASFALNLFVCFCAKGIWANYLSLLNLPVAWLW